MSENGERPKGFLESARERAGRFISEIPTYARQLREDITYVIQSFEKPWQPLLFIAGMVTATSIMMVIHSDPEWMLKKIALAWGIAIPLALAGASMSAWAYDRAERGAAETEPDSKPG